MDYELILEKWDYIEVECYISDVLGFGKINSSELPMIIYEMPYKDTLNINGERKKGKVSIVVNNRSDGNIGVYLQKL